MRGTLENAQILASPLAVVLSDEGEGSFVQISEARSRDVAPRQIYVIIRDF
jgi:hypothetical protein